MGSGISWRPWAAYRFLSESKILGTFRSIEVSKKKWPDATLRQGDDFALEGGSSATVQRMVTPQEQNRMSEGPVEIKDLVKTYVDNRSRATNAIRGIQRIAKEGTV